MYLQGTRTERPFYLFQHSTIQARMASNRPHPLFLHLGIYQRCIPCRCSAFLAKTRLLRSCSKRSLPHLYWFYSLMGKSSRLCHPLLIDRFLRGMVCNLPYHCWLQKILNHTGCNLGRFLHFYMCQQCSLDMLLPTSTAPLCNWLRRWLAAEQVKQGSMLWPPYPLQPDA